MEKSENLKVHEKLSKMKTKICCSADQNFLKFPLFLFSTALNPHFSPQNSPNIFPSLNPISNLNH